MDSRIALMRNVIVLLTAGILLTSCVPLQNPNTGITSSSASTAQSSSSSTFPIEFSTEIEKASSSSATTGTGALAERMAERGILEIGRPDAPHLLTVFTNYSCRYCAEFFRDMLPQLCGDFMNDGVLRVQIIIVPLKKYPNSSLEASALLCGTTFENGQEMHAALLEARVRDRTSILAWAKKLQLPVKDFTKCLDAKETKNLLAQQQAFITQQDVTLIPTFILDGEKHVGLPTFADLRGWIRVAITH